MEDDENSWGWYLYPSEETSVMSWINQNTYNSTLSKHGLPFKAIDETCIYSEISS